MSALHDAWFWCWRWYIVHGVAGNIAASAILGVPAIITFHRMLWKKHIKPLVRKVHEVHAHLDPTHPFTLGGNQDGTNSSGR